MPSVVKRHNIKLIVSGRDQQAAARMLYNILLLRRRLAGVSMAFLARRFGLAPSSLTASYNEIGIVLDKLHGGYAFVAPPYSRIERDQAKYMPTLDQLEIDACAALKNDRAEMLIRGTFMEGTKDIAVFRAREKRVRKGPGRPVGSTKDRNKAPEEGWLMPDGTRFYSRG